MLDQLNIWCMVKVMKLFIMSLSPSSCYFFFVPTIHMRTLQSINMKMLPSDESVKMRNSVQHFATCYLVKTIVVYEPFSSPHCYYYRSGTLLLHAHGYYSQLSGSFICLNLRTRHAMVRQPLYCDYLVSENSLLVVLFQVTKDRLNFSGL